MFSFWSDVGFIMRFSSAKNDWSNEEEGSLGQIWSPFAADGSQFGPVTVFSDIPDHPGSYSAQCYGATVSKLVVYVLRACVRLRQDESLNTSGPRSRDVIQHKTNVS